MSPGPKGGYVKAKSSAADPDLPADFHSLSKPKLWYDKNPATTERLKALVVEACSISVKRVHSVIEVLTQALAAGIEDDTSNAIVIGKEQFRDRADLKAKCQSLLKACPDDGQLDEEDMAFMLQLLAHHPRGAEKASGCQTVAAGVHPTFTTRCFYVVRKDGREDFSYIRCIDNAPTFQVECKARICDAICSVLQVHPAAMQRFASHVEEMFPPLRGPTSTVERHRNWALSILMLCTRMPALTEFLLILLVRRMVQIDSDVNKLEAALPDEALGDGGPADDEDVRQEIDRMAQILDCNMMLSFEFLQRHLATPKKGQDDGRMVLTLLGIFENAVLFTHKVRCVQFLWFYLASLRPGWAEAYLSLLLQTAYAPVQAPDRRVLATSYLASFVARAGFLPAKYALRTTQYLAVLTREQLEAAEKGHNSPAQLRLLVALVQAVCYVLCWWVEGFAQEEVGKGVTGLDTLLPNGGSPAQESFIPVLESVHWPFARIRRAVAKEFCRRIRSYRPKLTEILMQQLKKVPAPRDNSEQELTHSFFPFDPYRLRHSNMFLMGIYRSWSPNDEDSDEFEDSDAEGKEDGFAEKKEAELARARAMSVYSQAPATRGRAMSASSEVDDEAESDVDFTDEADVARRGFIPSVGPSPAFHPRNSVDMLDVSPLLMPMASLDENDNFSLPQATIDTADHMASMLQNPAYRS